MADKRIVQSVVRALCIIELLDTKGELGVTEIARLLGLDKSTAFRLISTLRYKGYITQNSSKSNYMNSYKLFELGNNVLKQARLPDLAYPIMRAIAEKTGEAVYLSIRDGVHVVYIEKIETDDLIKVGFNLGQRKPVHCTGAGKAMLSLLPEARVRELMKDMEWVRFTPQTLTNIDDFVAELKSVREAGYAFDNEEHHRGIICFAAPIVNFLGEPVAAISISVPKYKSDHDPEKRETCVRTLLEEMAALTKVLSGC